MLKNIGTWTHVLTTRIHLEYLAWQLHPIPGWQLIPGFRVELVKRRHDIGTPSLYTWKVTLVSGPQGYPYNPPKVVFQNYGLTRWELVHPALLGRT